MIILCVTHGQWRSFLKQTRVFSGTKHGMFTLYITTMDAKVEIAADFLRKDRSGKITSSLAMQYAGFSETQLCDRNLQRRVLRKKKSSPEGIAVTIPSTEDIKENNQQISPISLASTASTVSTISGGSSSSTSSLKEKLPKSMRLTSKQAHAVRKDTAIEKAETTDTYKTAMKEATIMYQNDQDTAKEALAQDEIYKKMTGRSIAELVNAKYGTNIQDRTIRKQVSEGKAGLSPDRRGPKGTIGSRYYKALCGAFESYVKLKQVTRDSNLKRTFLQKLVNAVVNKHPDENRSGRTLFERLQTSVAATLGIGKVDKIEERRNKWTTYSNVNIWYCSLKEFLIEEGFAVENDEVNFPGELLYGEGQIERLGNIDETGMVIDTTKSQKGGRESVVFYDPLISDGPEMSAHKNSFSGTLMQGCTAGKELVPPHFQLPSDAMTEDGMRISSDFIKDMKLTLGKFGHNELKEFPCTYGMNTKGGMNGKEFSNYMINCYLPLYPDAADLPTKRVCVLVDGGPGRTNTEMLASLRLSGLLLFPSGPPNTTHVLQIMDMLFGLFKTVYFENLETLWLERLADRDVNSTVTRNDLGLLMFGGPAGSRPESPMLQNAVELAFSEKRIGDAWENKLGVVPFTRAALADKKVRHEIVLNEDGEADETIDPQSAYLEDLRILNHSCCDILNVAGYDGELLRVNVPRFNILKRQKNMTKPRTKERQDAIAAGGSIFLKAGGRTLNDDDYFIAKERTQRTEKAKELRAQANSRIQAEKRGAIAHAIMEKKIPSKYIIADLKALIAWRTGKPCPSKVKGKDEFVKLWNEAKKIPVPTFEMWTEADEQALVELEETVELEGAIVLEDTDYGRLARQRQHECMASVADMSATQIAALEEMIAATKLVDC
jgi:hypothetical protein